MWVGFIKFFKGLNETKSKKRKDFFPFLPAWLNWNFWLLLPWTEIYIVKYSGSQASD